MNFDKTECTIANQWFLWTCVNINDQILKSTNIHESECRHGSTSEEAAMQVVNELKYLLLKLKVFD